MQAGIAERVAKSVRRVLAPNPSPMTGPGTNSYILGEGSVILVDPGPQISVHLTALMTALQPGERIASIIVTHAHLDHSAAAPAMAARTGAQVLAFGDATSGRSEVMERLAAAGVTGGGEGVDTSFRPDGTLADGDVITTGETRVRVIHTPGHMGGHICLGFGDVLLSGDHAMGWASSLVSPPDGDMGAYMASLARLEADVWALMLPGHGAAVTDVATRLTELRDHRLMREAAVCAVLAQGPATPKRIAEQIYTETPVALMGAARRNVLAHLIDLTERKLAWTESLPGPDAVFQTFAPRS